MNSRNLILIVILAVILILGGCGCTSYNSLVSSQENVNRTWNNVQSDYQRRADLVPNLVNTVKGAANFEQSTLTQVIEARSKASSINISADSLTPQRMQQFQQAQAQLSGALSRLLVTVERYPELKATQNFMQLQNQLEQIENEIRNSRNQFNAGVNEYNVKVRSFPTNIFAGMLGFHPKPGFAADPGSQKSPQVQF